MLKVLVLLLSLFLGACATSPFDDCGGRRISIERNTVSTSPSGVIRNTTVRSSLCPS